MHKAKHFKPIIFFEKPKLKCRQLFYQISQSDKFDYFILFIILLNTFVLSIKWVGMSPEELFYTRITNYTFTAIFFVEATIKIIGLGKNYFKVNFNIFDFFLVIVSTTIVVIEI